MQIFNHGNDNANCIKYIPNASGYWWEIKKMEIEKRNRENIIKFLF